MGTVGCPGVEKATVPSSTSFYHSGWVGQMAALSVTTHSMELSCPHSVSSSWRSSNWDVAGGLPTGMGPSRDRIPLLSLAGDSTDIGLSIKELHPNPGPGVPPPSMQENPTWAWNARAWLFLSSALLTSSYGSFRTQRYRSSVQCYRLVTMQLLCSCATHSFLSWSLNMLQAWSQRGVSLATMFQPSLSLGLSQGSRSLIMIAARGLSLWNRPPRSCGVEWSCQNWRSGVPWEGRTDDW